MVAARGTQSGQRQSGKRTANQGPLLEGECKGLDQPVHEAGTVDNSAMSRRYPLGVGEKHLREFLRPGSGRSQ